MNTNTIRIGCLLVIFYCTAQTLTAQWQAYKAAYPQWPFSIEQVTATGNSKCSVWKSRYQRAEGDESGQLWSTPVEDAHQYQRYQFYGGKPAMVSTYVPSGDRLETMEYFYKNGLLSAIEVLAFDTLQKSKVKYALQYLYYQDNDAPAQCTKLYGPPYSRVRLLQEFEFDEQKRLTRQKSTVVGFVPKMDSLLGLQPDEKRMVSIRYEDSVIVQKSFRDLHFIVDDRMTYLNADKKPYLTEVRNEKGQKLWTIDYVYEGEQLVKKVHWVRRTAPAPQEAPTDSTTVDKKGKGKKNKTGKAKKRKKDEEIAPVQLVLLDPTVYKVEYFRYNADGLLEQHIVEEEDQQIVLEYSYFSE